MRDHLTELGLTDPKALDLLTAIGNGLADQRISNDPGGDRWSRLVDEAMEMLFTHMTTQSKSTREVPKVMTMTDIDQIKPITGTEAVEHAATENQRMLELLRSLGAEDWTKPTDCPAWDVRAMAGHSSG